MDANRVLPPDAHQLVTKDDLTAAFEIFDAKMDARFARMDVGFAEIDARFARSEATLTRRMITIMGAWTILFGSTIGWALALVR